MTCSLGLPPFVGRGRVDRVPWTIGVRGRPNAVPLPASRVENEALAVFLGEDAGHGFERDRASRATRR